MRIIMKGAEKQKRSYLDAEMWVLQQIFDLLIYLVPALVKSRPGRVPERKTCDSRQEELADSAKTDRKGSQSCFEEAKTAASQRGFHQIPLPDGSLAHIHRRDS
jgi:hypothetical protein